MGRLVAETVGNDYRRYTYAPNGQVASEENNWYRTSYIYDGAGRTVGITETELLSAGGSTDNLLTYTKTYEYDSNDNRTGFTLTQNNTVIQNVSYTYDNLNRLSTVSEDGTEQATYTYDTDGNRSTLTYANGVAETYTYNEANWVTGVYNKRGNTILSSYEYTYYPSGNQMSKTDHTGKVTNYIYDGLGRLEQESDTSGLTISYYYDAAQNRSSLSYSDGTESYNIYYTYDANNRLTQERKRQDGVFTTIGTYTYDGNGNQLTKTSENGTEFYAYNGFNQQTSHTVGTTTAAYAYNPKGIRTAKTIGTDRTSYLLDGGNVVGELQNNTVSATYLRGTNLISREADNSTSYYLYNAHGDVTGLTNETGTVSKTYNYTAFGIEQNPDATDENPFRYCGEYYDTETGTYYLRARYYDPALGRFTQMDTYRGDPSDPLTLNLYTYCLNNPVCYVDSTGNAAEDVTRAIARAVIANPLAVRATQQGWAPDLFEAGGFIRDTNGVYHAHVNAWQQIGGYNNLYDKVFHYATSMDKAMFDFSSGDRNYVLWAWKGNYLNLGAGAELGIYSNISGFAGHGRFASPIAEHWLVDTNLAMKMTLTLTDKDGNLIFRYAPDEKQWWITGFNPFCPKVQSGDLTATYTVAFNDKQMYQDFYNKYGDEASKYWDSRWSFDPETYTATFTF